MPDGETWILKDQLDALQSEIERLRRELAEIKADPFKLIREMGVHDTSCYADVECGEAVTQPECHHLE